MSECTMTECGYKRTSAMTWKQFYVWMNIFVVMHIVATVVVPRAIPQKWEYRTYYMQAHSDGYLYGTDLEKFGEEGWELVNMLPTGNRQVICTLKRPVLLGGGDDEEEAEEEAREEERERQARAEMESQLL